MSLSNKIANIILKMLENNGTAEIKRNDLAQQLGCAPSQINYVISKRFTTEHGYFVESQRGSGGYIRITRVVFENESALQHAINSIGDSIDSFGTRSLISNLVANDTIDNKSAKIINAALSDYSLKALSPEIRDNTRAQILKNTLLVYGKDE